jgi:NAD(P)-dependent dehydrogenase (short-subunit alcohol dehydrogenase family)
MPEPKNILITGAARGVGRILARYLALRGHRLFLVDIDEEELKYSATVHIPQFLAETSGLSNGSHGKEVEFKTVDLRNPLAVHEAVKSAAEFFGGKIDVLINNAGIARAQWSGDRSMDNVSVNDEWAAYLDTNLTAPFLVSQACIPFMKIEDKERKEDEFCIRPEAQASAAGKPNKEISESAMPTPCIIHISSFRALQSAPNCEGYAATKAGLLGLTHAMAISGARWGIRCNAILPGFIYVLHECRKGDEAGETWAQPIPESRHRQHPAGRIGCGEDVVKTVEWLMDADFVTGQEIIVDGGCSKVKYYAA